MGKHFKILVINPGSTTTKIAVFSDEEKVTEKELLHDSNEINAFEKISDQMDYRLNIIQTFLRENNLEMKDFDCISARGGNMYPVEGGTYRISEKMINDLKEGVMGQHASNLAGILAAALAKSVGIPAFVVDPVIVDELDSLSRFSGIPQIKRKSKDHPLNQRAAARKAAESLRLPYEKCNFIVAHMGGGTSVGTHKQGRIVDVNNCLDGDGPFSTERAGGLPVGSLIDMCYSGDYTKVQMKKLITGHGGMFAYLGTKDFKEVIDRINNGDEYAKTVVEAMAYQIAKEIGAAATVLAGQINGIVFTGGLARSEYFVTLLKQRVEFLSRIFVFPGTLEMEALNEGALRVLRNEEDAKEYMGEIQ